MSRITLETHTPDDFFSRHALELTYRLLRDNNPGLANAIKNTLSHIHVVPYETIKGMHTGEMYFNAELCATLSAHSIGKIVFALTELGEKALKNHGIAPDSLNQLRGIIEDWVQLTEWILQHFTPDKTAYH